MENFKQNTENNETNKIEEKIFIETEGNTEKNKGVSINNINEKILKKEKIINDTLNNINGIRSELGLEKSEDIPPSVQNEQDLINKLNNNKKLEDSEKNKIQNRLEQFFNDNPENQERFFESVKVFIKNGILDETTISKLRESLTKDKDVFMNEATIILNPLLKAKLENPKLIEEIRRDSFVEEGNFIKLNEILSYGISKNVAHIHLAPLKELLRELGKGKILELTSDGLKNLAQVFKENENLKRVTATSPVVANNPEYLSSFGFTFKGIMSEEDKEKHWKGESKAVGEAEMSRERLLEYLNK